MRLLRSLSRVAFICNICFLITVLQRYLPHPLEGEVIQTILVMGFFLGAIVNILLHVPLIIMFLIGRIRRTGVPVWLLIVNFLFFIAQIYIMSISYRL
ncbi:MAG: hypothetical protein Q8927_01925 [Bacteroidota bacterium]|nr:hypothetical protein [Bacteroidota bacterium]MDP4214929.1 hypothetical protein [Bacteroidota bacterium]MDP4246615.1 hypothetical protein [Bacteroidota bacterium]MDP4255380.1 hypothetical protein [Bacteroidota bacterium]MDP4258856.1 hypothetical protein [Bacteroidota bacterium]